MAQAMEIVVELRRKRQLAASPRRLKFSGSAESPKQPKKLSDRPPPVSLRPTSTLVSDWVS